MRIWSCVSAALLTLVLLAGIAAARPAANAYRTTILVSNEEGEAPVTDDKLVNAWGIAASPTMAWWVANNGTGSSTVYDATGAKQLEVTVPGAPTGMVFNGGSQFEVSSGNPADFIWATEDGTFLAWNHDVSGTTATVVLNDPGSSYKGLAIRGDTLYTTDFADCEVEAFDGTFTEFDTSGGFEDDSIPDTYCPFGIQAIGDSIFVTYAKRGPDGDDIAGKNHGFVREFDANGNLIAKVASHDHLNSPWGVALAPADFGSKFGGCLLVGDFGDGRIHGFCRDKHGKWQHTGHLNENGKALVIDGLWGIGFGNGGAAGPMNVLYFAAGPDHEENGYFGKVESVE